MRLDNFLMRCYVGCVSTYKGLQFGNNLKRKLLLLFLALLAEPKRNNISTRFESLTLRAGDGPVFLNAFG